MLTDAKKSAELLRELADKVEAGIALTTDIQIDCNERREDVQMWVDAPVHSVAIAQSMTYLIKIQI